MQTCLFPFSFQGHETCVPVASTLSPTAGEAPQDPQNPDAAVVNAPSTPGGPVAPGGPSASAEAPPPEGAARLVSLTDSLGVSTDQSALSPCAPPSSSPLPPTLAAGGGGDEGAGSSGSSSSGSTSRASSSRSHVGSGRGAAAVLAVTVLGSQVAPGSAQLGALDIVRQAAQVGVGPTHARRVSAGSPSGRLFSDLHIRMGREIGFVVVAAAA